MDINAHSKLEIVLNEEGENEEEKRFNEIICYDSGDSGDEEENENVQNDTIQSPNGDISLQQVLQNQPIATASHPDRVGQIEKRSNAAQMRKYRARQRNDPIRYKQYLERERNRNNKRKYERRIQEAQERAQEMGVPYIVLEPPHQGRGRRPKFDEVSVVFPADYNIDDAFDSFYSNGMPVQAELKESDESCREEKPKISVVNINKLTGQPRSALQTLLPQEVNDRQRVSNFIKLEHDYVKRENLSMFGDNTKKRSKKRKRKMDKNELLKLQQQCRRFILNQANAGSSSKPARKRRQRRTPTIQSTGNIKEPQPSHCVEHEDLDDLFKELAEVAAKRPPKKKHSSPHKGSPVKRSTHKQSFWTPKSIVDDGGDFSLNVCMPVQRIAPTFNFIDIEPKISVNPFVDEESFEYKSNSTISSDNVEAFQKRVYCSANDIFLCNENSIEIKQETPYSDDDFF